MDVSGSMAAAPKRRTVRWGTAISLAIAGLVAGLTVASVSMAGAATEPTQTPSTQAPLGQQFRGGMRGGMMGGGGIHGEFTTPDPDGGYQRLASQVGEATAVSSSSITVKSADGFSRTYAIDGSTVVNAGDNGIADVAKGDTVRVVAEVSGSTYKATRIVDRTKMQELGAGRQGRGMGRGTGQGPCSTSTPSASTTPA